jgi:hypothetical protein
MINALSLHLLQKKVIGIEEKEDEKKEADV